MVTKADWDQQTQKNLTRWLEGDYDAATKAELRLLMEKDPDAINDAFYTTLRFGTAGLRGLMGLGTNRINRYTVRQATQGLANYLKQTIRHQGKVLIGYDSRHHSHNFAVETARVLAGNGIQALLFRDIRPVPLVSFGVTFLHCDAGVMITASHNPPEYNGYKVYWNHGGQVLPPHDKGIIDEVNQIESPSQVMVATENDAHITWLDQSIDVAYLSATENIQIFSGQNHQRGHELHVIYTPLHGTGITIVPHLLRRWGFTQITAVESQMLPDGNFSTVTTPNPEDHAAMQRAVTQMMETGSDLALATDPDADRLGVVVRHANTPVYLSGNQIACLLLDHIASGLASEGRLPEQATAVKSLVTSELFRAICTHHKIRCLDVLTGFKYIGELIHQWESTKDHFLFGAEESYGCLAGTYARDKDAVIACALMCELALDCKCQGETLVDRLHTLYRTYGVYREHVTSLTFSGQRGATRMHALMQELRKQPPIQVAGTEVETVEDYNTDAPPGGLPRADVVRLWLSDGSTIVIRPSGTEPKVKFYCGTRVPATSPLAEAVEHADAHNQEILSVIKQRFSSA